MNVDRLLQVNIAALTVVGTLLLGLGQNNPMLPALSLFAAVTSIYFTDVLGWFRLHRVIANFAALGALFISMREFDIFGGNSATQLRAIANLLVYLQFVLLYQEKNQRVYWQLAVLSLLQVVVAAALDLRMGLGLLLMLYMFTALSAMALLFVYSQVESVQRPDGQPQRNSRRGDFSVWTPTDPPFAYRESSEQQIQKSLLGWSFVRRLGVIGAATWVLAMLAFFATPRLGNAVWRGPQQGGARTVGFSRDIRLGAMTEILQNDAPAMTLRILDRQGDPVLMSHPPYIRGAALSQYQYINGEGSWKQPTHSSGWHLDEVGPPPGGDWVETRFLLEPTGSELLFSIVPSYRADDLPPNVTYDLVHEQLIRATAGLMQNYTETHRYTLRSNGIRNGVQASIWPQRHPGDLLAQHATVMEFDRLVDWDPYRFSRTQRLARKVLDEAGRTPQQRYEAAKALEAFFLESGSFTYTLSPVGVPPRPSGTDPIEHFLLEHRQGHCEYFASALTIMLRTQGIPARIVVGYHGGDYNSLGKYYLVRQRDAHSWVEVYLEPEHIPEELRSTLPPDISGAWLRLDPTPSAAQAPIREGTLTPVMDAADYLETIWNEYVLGLNSDRQEESIYRPLVARVKNAVEKAKSAASNFSSGFTWRDFLRNFVHTFGLEQPDVAFPWKTLLVVLLLGASWIVLLRIAWRSARAQGYGEQLRRWLRRNRPAAVVRPGVQVDFYRRFEKLLSRRRFRRQRNQTHREFAAQVAGEIDVSPAWGTAVPLLDRVVEAYYRVRFGGRPLDSSEAAAIEKALDQLEQTLAKSQS